VEDAIDIRNTKFLLVVRDVRLEIPRVMFSVYQRSHVSI